MAEGGENSNQNDGDLDIATRISSLSLKAKRSMVLSQLRAIHTTLTREISAEEIETFRPSFNRLDVLRERFEEFQDQIILLNTSLPPESEIEVEILQAEFDRLFDEAQRSFLRKTLPALAGVSTLNNTSFSVSSIRLPKLELPKFSGDLGAWRTWYNLYKASVHTSPSLLAVQKFQYLLGSLKGDPLALITGLDITDANYDVAWTLLCERYHSERRHVFHHYNGLLDLPEAQRFEQIPTLITKIREHSQALQALGHPPESYSGLLTALIVRKLSYRLKQRLEDYRGADPSYPKLDELLSFLEKERRSTEDSPPNRKESKALVSCAESPSPPRPRSGKGKERKQKSPSETVSLTSSGEKTPKRSAKGKSTRSECPCCPKSHRIFDCAIFRNKPIPQRRDVIKEADRCFNCFSPHRVDSCLSTRRCTICAKKHNTLLHEEGSEGKPTKPNSSPGNPANKAEKSLVGTGQTPSTILLATARLRLKTRQGSVMVRGILDSASQGTLVTRECALKLGLSATTPTSAMSGLAQNRVETYGLFHVTLMSAQGKPVAKGHPISVVETITSPTPTTTIATSVRQLVQGWNLADPSFDEPGPVDILIGAELFPAIIAGPPHPLGPSLPSVFVTTLGAVLMGPAPSADARQSSLLTALLTATPAPTLTLHEELRKWWELEDVAPTKVIEPPEHPAETFFRETTVRLDSGSYMVRLPFSQSPEVLGDSKGQALRRFRSLEHRFRTNPELKRQYSEYMDGYLSAGHMVPAPPDVLQGPHYFFPHHPVFKETSSTHKLRVVMDASAKTTSGFSLNDIVHIGPSLIKDIRDVILNFRRHEVVFSCDIRQMYLQVVLDPKDRCFHLLYWRRDEKSALRIYQMTTVTFGVACSAFLAMRVLRQLAMDYRDEFPRAAQVILDETYVDDVASGDQNLKETSLRQHELVLLLMKGNFVLRKWKSNDPRLLESLALEFLELPMSFGDQQTSAHTIVGLLWLPAEDAFSYKIKASHRPYTKRGVLSAVATLFDPCGYLAPLTFLAKSYIQQLWLLQLGWDDPLPGHFHKAWDKFLETLPVLESLRLPRRLAQTSVPVELHAFSDGSELGFAAVVYMRTTQSPYQTYLISGKSKVAPLKKISIPRLELCGANLLAVLLQHVYERLKASYRISGTHAWSDSTTVLHWLQTPPYRLKTFVANRVAHVQELLPNTAWHYVETKDNPADPASRGLLAPQLVEHHLWWHGPAWLKDQPEKWTANKIPLPPSELPELKPTPSVLTAQTLSDPFQRAYDRASNYDRLLRIIAYALRFIHNCRKQGNPHSGPLAREELEVSERRVIRKIQRESFADDLKAMKKGSKLSCQISALNPFLDSHDLMRVGGRLENSELGYDAKHPWILPPKHPLVRSLIRTRHIASLHAGAQHLQALLSQRYWIIAARVQIRSIVKSCVICFRAKPRNTPPQMGQLPTTRVTPARCFATCGSDYAGPFMVKVSRIRNAKLVKVYLCIFVCHATRAIHIEVAEDLTADAFCEALAQMASRRGTPTDIYTDCGTQYRGACRTLKRTVADLNAALQAQPQPAGLQEVRGVNFHFSSAASPHLNGLSEAAVKSAKTHLTKIMQGQSLTLHEFRALTVRVEGMLNSRPLAPLSGEPTDLLPLTPAHFLSGGPLAGTPETRYEPTATPTKRWHRVQALAQAFWRRWAAEYLRNLAPRSKWRNPAPPLKAGQLVLIHEPLCHPMQWPMGRITEVYPGDDGQVRVASVRTSTGQIRRPAVKLFPLPEE